MGSMDNSGGHRNVVQIIADDLGFMLGCYGVGAIQTPNLDKLAAEGTRLTRAFASTAHAAGAGRRFTRVFTPTRMAIHVGLRAVYPWEWYSPGDNRDVIANAAEAGRFFDKAREAGRPFHLTIGYRDPRDATRGGFGNQEEDIQHIPVPDYKTEDVEIPEFISDVPELRQELVEYYKSINRMDHGVGLIMQELAQRGLDKNTLVMFISDNGAPFVNSKTTLYDAGIRLPLIFKAPNSPESSVVNPNMVSFLEILPTCIEWAGNPVIKTDNTEKSPPRLGNSFLKILGSREQLSENQWKQHVFVSHTFHEIQNYWPTRFMRTTRYNWEGLRNNRPVSDNESDTPEVMIGRRQLASYVYRGPEELFDLEADPEEVNNLASKPEYEPMIKDMRASLERWQYITDDAWLSETA